MKGWRNVKLGNICKISIGRTPSRNNTNYWGNGHSWLSISDMNQGFYLSETKEQITDTAIKECNMPLVKKGTLLMSFKLSVGKVGIAENDLYTNEAIAALKIIDSNVDKKYLAYSLQTLEFGKSGDRAVKGITLNKTKLNNLQIPLPPLPTQRRIAAILDKADALRRKNQQLLAAYDELLHATFLDMFGDPVTNPHQFLVGEIGDLVSSVNYGTSSKSSENGRFPYLRMNNITFSGEMDFSDLKYIDLSEKEEEKYLVKKGDLLFNRTNSKELVGKTAVFKESNNMAIAGYIIRVRTNSRANSDYISSYLNSKYGKAILRNLCKSIVGMANINAKELQKIKILIPPIALQNQFAQIVENIEAQKATLKKNIAESENLFNCLVQKAFSGPGDF